MQAHRFPSNDRGGTPSLCALRCIIDCCPMAQVMFQLFGEGENDPALRLPGVEARPLPREALPAPAQAKVDLYFL